MADSSPDWSDLFLPIIGPDGQRTGLIARDVAEAIASMQPLPTQETLDDVLAQASRVRFLGPRRDGRWVYTDVPLVDTSDRTSIARLRTALRIVGTGGHLMTGSTHVLEVTAGDRVSAEIGVIEASVLRWAAAWRGDANLCDPMPLLDWLADSGVPALRAEHLARVTADEQDVTE